MLLCSINQENFFDRPLLKNVEKKTVNEMFIRVLGAPPLTRAFVFNKCHTCPDLRQSWQSRFHERKTCLMLRHILDSQTSGFAAEITINDR